MKSVKPMTDAERTRKHRKHRREEGWRLVHVFLEPRSTAIVDSLVDQGLTTAQAVNRCIQENGK
jgi:hypothetical protein